MTWAAVVVGVVGAGASYYGSKRASDTQKGMMGYSKHATWKARKDIKKGFDLGIKDLRGFQGMLRPGMDRYMNEIVSGKNLQGLRDLQQEYYNYKGPTEQDMAYDPYRQYMDAETIRNTRMAQAARSLGGRSLMSSAGIGQEERALSANAADAYRYRDASEKERLMNSFGLLSQITGMDASQLAGIASMYGDTTGNIAQMYANKGTALASNGMSGAGMYTNLGQGLAGMQQGMYSNALNAGLGAAGSMQGLQSGAQSLKMNNQVMNSPYYNSMLNSTYNPGASGGLMLNGMGSARQGTGMYAVPSPYGG